MRSRSIGFICEVSGLTDLNVFRELPPHSPFYSIAFRLLVFCDKLRKRSAISVVSWGSDWWHHVEGHRNAFSSPRSFFLPPRFTDHFYVEAQSFVSDVLFTIPGLSSHLRRRLFLRGISAFVVLLPFESNPICSILNLFWRGVAPFKGCRGIVWRCILRRADSAPEDGRVFRCGGLGHLSAPTHATLVLRFASAGDLFVPRLKRS